jgi:hypothetical protein
MVGFQVQLVHEVHDFASYLKTFFPLFINIFLCKAVVNRGLCKILAVVSVMMAFKQDVKSWTSWTGWTENSLARP